MSHVDHEQSTDFVRDSTKSCIIDDARVSAGSGHNQLRSLLLCQSPEFVVVDSLSLLGNAVRNNTIKHSWEIHRATHRQVTAVGEVHAQIAISGFEHSEI